MNIPRLNSILSTLNRLTDDISIPYPMKNMWERCRIRGGFHFGWPALTIGSKTARIPIIQGGMGLGISLSRLASAVADTGGIGVIAANCIGLIEHDYFKDGRAANIRALRREIRTARAQTTGLIGVNIMVAMNDFYQLLDVSIEERVDLIIMGAGLPVKNIPVKKMRDAGVLAAPIVSSARAARIIFKMWEKNYHDVPDAVILEGPLAGGHLGFSKNEVNDPAFRLEELLPDVVTEVAAFEASFNRKIPVIAAGGIFTGEDIHSIMLKGASGVQMGTRFVATDECDADDRFKQAYVDCTTDQIGLIDSPVGMPGRAIRNEFILATEKGRFPSFRCAWQCLANCKAEKAHYCISIALNNARRGDLDHGFVFVGANADRVKEIVPVATLIHRLAEEYSDIVKEMAIKRLDKLERLVAGIQALQIQYNTLCTRFRETGQQYEKRMKEIQARIIENLEESWALVNSVMPA